MGSSRWWTRPGTRQPGPAQACQSALHGGLAHQHAALLAPETTERLDIGMWVGTKKHTERRLSSRGNQARPTSLARLELAPCSLFPHIAAYTCLADPQCLRNRRSWLPSLHGLEYCAANPFIM
jgi:hypothetical protein